MRYKALIFLTLTLGLTVCSSLLGEPGGPQRAIAPLVIAGIVAAVGAIANSIIQSSSSKKQMERTNAANLELAKYQATENERLIDKQNAYNSPIAQMTRFGNAGLNPNLMYGQGSPGNQAQPAKYEAPKVDMHFDPMQIPDLLSMYQDFAMKKAQTENIEANTSLTMERNMLSKLAGRAGEFELGKKRTLFPYEEDIMQSRSQQQRTVVNQLFENLKQTRMREPMIGIQQNKATQDALFSSLRNEWAKMGVTSSDNMFVRVLARMLDEGGFQIPGLSFNKNRR